MTDGLMVKTSSVQGNGRQHFLFIEVTGNSFCPHRECSMFQTKVSRVPKWKMNSYVSKSNREDILLIAVQFKERKT